MSDPSWQDGLINHSKASQPMTSYTDSPAPIYFSYALVSCGTVALAEFPLDSGGGNQKLLLDMIAAASDGPRSTTVTETHRYAFLIGQSHAEVTCSCIAAISLSVDNAFVFLQELKQQGLAANSLTPTEPNKRFGPSDLSTLLRSYNSTQYGRIQAIRDHQRDARLAMARNISLALERGEAIDEMARKGENLHESAQDFHRKAIELRQELFCV
jgi:hypothetical protein